MVEGANEPMDQNATPNANEIGADAIHFHNGVDPTREMNREPSFSAIIDVSNLNQCFHAVLLGSKVRISFPTYKHIVQIDLQVLEIATMNESDVTVLAKCLNYFMTQWPGWVHRNTFADGPIQITTWFTDYRDFLKDRVMYVVNNMESLWENAIAEHVEDTELKRRETFATNGEGTAIREDVKPDANHFDCSVQTDQLDFAPYHLAFSGQPSVLNSLYFVITQDGHASPRFHDVLKLRPISDKQLLSSPYVSVNVTLPEISFGRKMDHKYTRYISTRPLKKNAPPMEGKISAIKRMDTSKYDTSVYTFAFLKEYLTQFIQLLKKHKLVTEGRISELQTICGEFLDDVADCKLYGNTMATNMSVTFRLGGHTYVRNKVWRQGKFGAIIYVERIDPRATFFLKSVSAEEDKTTAEPSFTLLNNIDRALRNQEMDDPDLARFLQQLRDDENWISYSCTLCEKMFSYYLMLYKHYSSEHGGEQAVLCEVCNEKQNVLILTTKRWSHRCRGVAKEECVINTIPSLSSAYNSATVTSILDDASSTASGAGSFLDGLMTIKDETIVTEPKQEDPFMDIVDPFLDVVDVQEIVVDGHIMQNGI